MADEPNVQNQNPAGGNNNDPNQPVGKMMTQEEIDNIVAKRVARATKGMPSEEELNAFRDWQKSHNDTVISNLTNERDTAQKDLATAKAELEAMKRGVRGTG